MPKKIASLLFVLGFCLLSGCVMVPAEVVDDRPRATVYTVTPGYYYSGPYGIYYHGERGGMRYH